MDRLPSIDTSEENEEDDMDGWQFGEDKQDDKDGWQFGGNEQNDVDEWRLGNDEKEEEEEKSGGTGSVLSWVIDRIRSSTDQERYIVSLILAGVTLLLSSPVAWNYYDVHLFMLTWSEELQHGWNIYATGNSNYPPLATYLFVGLELFARNTAPVITSVLGIEEIGWVRIIARVPLIIGYLFTASLLYQRWGWSTARYWLFTPPTLIAMMLLDIHFGFAILSFFSWTTLIPLYTFWGYQFDLLAVPLTLLALFSLLDDKPAKFGLYLGIGTMVKFYPIILIPLGLARFSIRDQLRAGLLSTAVILGISLPFLLTTPGEFYYQLFGFQGERFPQGLSIYHVPLLLTHYHVETFTSFSFLTWLWQVVWLPIFASIVLAAWSTTDDDDLILAFGAALLSMIAFNKIGNMNYFVWMWPFVLFALDRGYLSWKLPTLMIGTVTAYVLTFQMAAAVVDKPMFIVQEFKWYSARRLVVESYQGSAQEGFLTLLMSINSHFGWLAGWLYNNLYAILPIVIVIHFIVMVMMLISIMSPLFSVSAIRQRLTLLLVELDEELHLLLARLGIESSIPPFVDMSVSETSLSSRESDD